ncbi:DUF3604 domain-containing protein [Halieaceae bacterium IMCC14734]|uniref:DUF3604 domain-containing protein n=1 Tax=Candidatus Litorirhabdus singularis TaxID=2518993 RepID=A0ABT3TD14_9GAMM|nr:DUF3604 domain-containing protein [Candidatus Litorirhabdus singularis]MCX2980163.1 DUF3604 domain-containing protein [Candidatus Litorirhabdus singularis]
MLFRVLRRCCLASVFVIPATAIAGDYSPYVDRTGQERVFWGDTHLHTQYSTDAGMIGTTLKPEQAYRFAMGEEVTSSTGLRARLQRPLDFLVVSDHAESLGLPIAVQEAMPELLGNPWGREVYDLEQKGDGYAGFYKWAIDGMLPGVDPLGVPAINANIWQRQVTAADQYNRPGYFTALIGYEWTTTKNAKNLHRVVIFRDAADKAGQIIPFSSFDSSDPEDLWSFLEDYETNTGGQVLAIPHNGNLSNGLMFAPVRQNGQAMDETYARRRAHWEPLTEVTQIKGDGEAHPWLSPDDEFADFGTWDKGDIGGREAKSNDMLEFEYARSALRNGLKYGAAIGVNPFKFGMIGASDSHTGLAATREENYYGKFSKSEPAAGRWKEYVVRSPTDDALSLVAYEEVASGLAGVWAQENTREALFDAMRRREVYSTTGTRMVVRLFGGWEYVAADVQTPAMAQIGYRKGVPMGADLPPRDDAKAPVFMVMAAKDPDGANLDRIQMIKGWLNPDGQTAEKIYDIALSDDRSEGQNGQVPVVGNTVDVADASYTNTIGAAQLRRVWSDPDFDPDQRAFYYARVLEIPTPSWQAYDTKIFGDEFPESVPMSIQDRAYTSPIWYTP